MTASTIARALKSIQAQYEMATRWETIKEKINRKVVLLPSGDQDNTIAIASVVDSKAYN